MAKAAKPSPSSTGRPRRAAAVSSPYSKTVPLASSSRPASKSTSPKKRGRPPKKEGKPAAQPELEEEQEDDEQVEEGLEAQNGDDEPAEDWVKDEEDQESQEKDDEEVRRKGKDNDVCPQCNRDGKEGADSVWVECDNCTTWYHWVCVAPTLTATLENIDKWYCSPCIISSAGTSFPLVTTYKPGTAPPGLAAPPPVPPSSSSTPTGTRKSQRSTRSKVDYANLDQHLPASVDKWTKVITSRKKDGKIVDGFIPASEGGGGFKRMHAREITDEWVYRENGMTEPFVVETSEGLGMRMPPKTITVRDVANLVGPKTPLDVIDCASQSALNNWNLEQWADYYADPSRDKVRNVISLEVSESRLGEMVVAPELVRKLDWVETVWPADMKSPGEYPRVQKYCLMSVERSWTDWHVDFAGSSVFYHIIRGGKTFYFIRPTPANLQAYERWSGSTERQEHSWLGDSVDMVYEVNLLPGNTAFIPTGWIHAVYTPSDSLVIGGNFLHSLNIPTQLRIYQIELATKVPRKFRYPHFVRLLWLVAWKYHTLLSSYTLPPTPENPLPVSLGAPRILDGLKQLSSFLIEQTQRFAKGSQASAERRRLARENIPTQKIQDPVTLSREFRKVVLKARGEELDDECFLPHVVVPQEQPGSAEESAAASPAGSTGSGGGAAGGAAAAGSKRKASDALDPSAYAVNGNGTGHGHGAMLLPHPAQKHAKIKHASPALPNGGAYPVSLPAFPPPSSFAPSALPLPAPPAGSADANGTIIGRQTVPVVQHQRMEERIDPARQELGALPADVRESRSTQSVVRRWERDPAQGGGEGPVVETRTVITIVERVRWTGAAGSVAATVGMNGYGAGRPGSSGGTPYSGYSLSQPYAGAPSPSPSSAYQPQGVGPPAPPPPPVGSSTLTPQQQAHYARLNNSATTNPPPYPSYGYPYHYQLPSQITPSSGNTPPVPSPHQSQPYPHYPRPSPSVLAQPPQPQQPSYATRPHQPSYAAPAPAPQAPPPSALPDVAAQYSSLPPLPLPPSGGASSSSPSTEATSGYAGQAAQPPFSALAGSLALPPGQGTYGS